MHSRRRIKKSERVMGQISAFDIDSRGLLTIHGRVWVSYSGGAKHVLMEKAHKSKFSIHPGATKMYRGLRHRHWCLCMKRDIAWYVA